MSYEIVTPQQASKLVAQKFEEQRKRMEGLLPKGLEWDRSLSSIQTAIARSPDLQRCDPMTILTSAEFCWTLGLEVNGPLMQAFIIPFGKTAVPIIGYKGWIDMLRRCDPGAEVLADVVYEDEVNAGLFKIARYPMTLKHDYDLTGSIDRSDSKIVGAYARIVLSSGVTGQIYLPIGELRKLEQSSQTKWTSNKNFPRRFAGMCRKTALLQLFHKGEIPVALNRDMNRAYHKEIETTEEMRKADYKLQEVPEGESLDGPEITGSEPYEYEDRDKKEQRKPPQRDGWEIPGLDAEDAEFF